MLDAKMYGFLLAPASVDQAVSFEYVHSLSIPTIRPAPALIVANPPLLIEDSVVLRFGMMEGSALVRSDWCVYDPQSSTSPERFSRNGSQASHLAVVANRGEALRLSGKDNVRDAAKALLQDGAEAVVVKSGEDGAFVIDASGEYTVPPYQSERTWTVGSGDVFAAIFATEWAISRNTAFDAARMASRAVAEYVNTMDLPIPLATILAAAPLPEAKSKRGKIYLAGPFFSLGQRWVVDEARRCLLEFGMDVFSPVHEIGHGLADEVAPADLAALDTCDAVFAILDGLDSGTIFEAGYGRAHGKPVYALAQNVTEEDLKMLKGSGCHIFDDFVTALHHLVWRP